jgi:hypothetical protein
MNWGEERYCFIVSATNVLKSAEDAQTFRRLFVEMAVAALSLVQAEHEDRLEAAVRRHVLTVGR